MFMKHEHINIMNKIKRLIPWKKNNSCLYYHSSLFYAERPACSYHHSRLNGGFHFVPQAERKKSKRIARWRGAIDSFSFRKAHIQAIFQKHWSMPFLSFLTKKGLNPNKINGFLTKKIFFGVCIGWWFATIHVINWNFRIDAIFSIKTRLAQ